MFYNYLFLSLLSSCLWNYLALSNNAQVIPDNTLGQEKSIVAPQLTIKDNVADLIEGGAIRENNLLHSFDKFSIPYGDRVYFTSPIGIDNIITRVTGNDLSNISGTLGVNGSANLFLLNPNGIIFGQNSQLDVAGSFLATTANSYIFDSDEYSASHPEAPALTVNIPLGLQFGSNPGQIINRSQRPPDRSVMSSIESESQGISEGLRISSGENLSLIGGEVIMEGGYLNTSEGTIELGAVGKDNIVKLTPQDNTWKIDYAEVDRFADIEISQQGGIDGGINGGSKINLTGKNIGFGYAVDSIKELGYETVDFYSFESLPLLDDLPSDQTQIIAHNQNNSIPSQININASNTFSVIDPGKEQQNILAHTFGEGNAGNMEIVGNSIILYGASLETWTLADATGDSGAINFTAENMSVQHGGGGVNTFGVGNGGTINLAIEENVKIQFGGFGAEVHDSGKGGTIQIDAENLDIRFAGFGVATFANGDGGTIDLNITDRLQVISGGFGADTFAEGKGGTIQIDAHNLELINAGMGAKTTGKGAGGEIRINANTILLQSGVISGESGQINLDDRAFDAEGLLASFNDQRNAGNGANIFVKAENISLYNGNITTTTYGMGNGGDIELQADSFEAIGIPGEKLLTGINSFTEGAGSGGEITINASNFRLSNGARVAADSSSIGQAGNITINTIDRLELLDKGEIIVNGGTNGMPGNIDIQGQDIVLERDSIISADTTQGIQGNITISGDSLSLSDRSQIVTDASQNATGGNIFINLKNNLIGSNNSQITAIAKKGVGGNIDINTKVLVFSADSQIDASSEFGVDGSIKVNTFVVDLNSSLIQLPTDPIDPSLYLSQGCSSHQKHAFVSVGRGGLPESPLNNIVQNVLLSDLGSTSIQKKPIPALDLAPISHSVNPIVEAQKWKINSQGKVELIASVNNSNIVQDQNACLQ